MTKQLHLYEEIMLLSLRDDKGTIHSSTMYQYAVAGAIVAEMLLEGRIRVDDSRKKMVELVRSTRLGDPLLDECLERIREAGRRGSLKTWVQRFARTKNLKHRVAQQLVRHGVLRADEDKVLFIFTRKIYPEVDPRPEKAIIERMRQAIFTDTREVDPRTVVLTSLAHGASLLRFAFEKKRLKERKERIKKIVNGEVVGKATADAIQAARAAVVVAAIVPAIVVTSTH